MADWKEIAKRKDKYLEKRESILNSKVTSLERKLFSAILDVFLSGLEFDEDGFAVVDGKNIDLVDAMDDLLQEFMNTEHLAVIKRYLKDLDGVSALNERYFKTFYPLDQKVKNKARNLSLQSLGITPSGKLITNGYIDRVLQGSEVINEIKALSYSAVMGGIAKRDMRKALKELIVTDENSGIMKRHYKTFINDTYSQFDRSETSLYAQELGMPVARYAGGKVKNSRPFCLARENRYILTSEIKRFGSPKDDFENYADKSIPNGGYDNHKAGDFKGKNKGYVPQRDLGGHNCIHRLNYITAKLAVKLDKSLIIKEGKLIRK